MTIDVIELFAGIGAQAQALSDLNIDYRVVAISEIDPFADTSYRAIHDTNVNNLGDITKIKSLPHCDLLTYSFPCTDISLAGKCAGMKAGKTRSGLLWEVERLLEDYERRGDLPKYLMLENVKNLTGKKFMDDFNAWLLTLELLGYKNYWKVLNAKNYGIPQNRERVIALSIRCDNGGGLDEIYEWPKQIPLNKTLHDMLEEEVSESYYINEDQLQRMLNSTYNQAASRLQQKDWADTLCARDWKDPKLVQAGTLVGGKWDAMHEQSKRVYSENGISPTLHTNGGGNLEPKVCIGAVRGRNPNNPSDRTTGSPTEQRLEINRNGTSNALTTVQKDNMVVERQIVEKRVDVGIRQFKDGCCGAVRTTDSGGDKRVIEIAGVYTGASPDFQRPPLKGLSRTLKAVNHDAGITDGIRVRKLTPRECWRLMGFKDDAFDRARAALMNKHYHGKDKANTQLYKQAGNSIVVDMLKAVFSKIKGLDTLW